VVQIHDTVGFDQKSRPVCSARLGEPSPYHKIDLDPASYEAATAWWIDLASSGGEGMVAKPPDFIGKGRRGTIHPAINPTSAFFDAFWAARRAKFFVFNTSCVEAQNSDEKASQYLVNVYRYCYCIDRLM
jgi:hypothetical protein